MTHDTSIDKLISDTLRDGGNSVEPATAILTQNWRGNSLEYLISLIGFLIPRSLWPDKPLIMYNFEITYLYTGNWPKPGNSIVTSTILGEAWYYFGVTGTFTLLVVFGAYAQLIEVMLSRTVWTLGIYYSTIYLSFILVRSTFLTYYQNGISALVAAGIVTLLCLWNLQQQNQRIHRTWSKSMQIGSTTCVKSSILQP
jgi:hypothetical protein